jgi:hypothetical protein
MASSFYQREPRELIGSSAVLVAQIYNQAESAPIPEADVHSVTFTVMLPTDVQGSPSILNQSGTVTGDGEGTFVVAGTFTQVAPTGGGAGHYRGIATFSYDDNSITPPLLNLTKAVPANFEITDPFDATGARPADPYVDQAWMKIEDCFDSELGGPWLRDMTLNVFDKYKLRELIPEVLLAINQQMPYTSFNEDGFPYLENDGGALFAEGLLVAAVRHLMRSYVEQPDIANSPVAFENRQRYQQAWQAVYEIELKQFEMWLTRWKLRAYDITNAALLVSSKAGRMMSGPMRTRRIFSGGF